MSDRRLLYAAAFVRAAATGMCGVLLGLHLAALGWTDGAIGLAVGSGLAGGAVSMLAATLGADRLGRRRSLVLLAALAGAGGAAVALGADPVLVLPAAFVGMANGMGRDRGAALVIEQSILPATVGAEERTGAFARYNVAQDIGHALGALLGALPDLLGAAGLGDRALPAALVLYALLSAAPAAFYLRLSAAAAAPAAARARLSPASRRIIGRISALFFVDSLGGGFLTTAMLAVFFVRRFDVGTGTIAALFLAARAANALSHLAAASLARRIGLVNTMVWTHLPSSLLLVTVACAPDFPTAAVLFLLREGLVEMDVPTRQSYVMAVVGPDERTVASGVTNLVRMAAWAIGPALAGASMEGAGLETPLYVGAALKIAYDLALYAAFRRVRPPEEIRAT
jgi:MFS family permease